MASPNPLDALLERIKSVAGDGASQQLLPDLTQFFDAFQLVPKSTFDNHLAALHALEEQVQALQARVAELESR